MNREICEISPWICPDSSEDGFRIYGRATPTLPASPFGPAVGTELQRPDSAGFPETLAAGTHFRFKPGQRSGAFYFVKLPEAEDPETGAEIELDSMPQSLEAG